MSSKVWDWLPDGALAAPEVMNVVDAALEDWSRRWFRSYRLVRHRLQFAAAPAAEPVVAAGPALRVRAVAENDEILAARALDLDLARLDLTADDQSVLEAFRGRLTLDLARTLEAALAAEDTPAGDVSGPVILDLRDEDGRKILTIETTRAALVRTRRRSLPPRSAGRPPLQSIEAAIAELPVTLQARLGSSHVPLSEARKLTAGDVIVLEHALDAPFDLTGLEGATIACATLVDTASPRSLRLQAAPRRPL